MSAIEQVDVAGEDITRFYKKAVTTSDYIKIAKLGTGIFEIITASIYPQLTQTYAIPARIRFMWDDGKVEYYNDLASGYIGAQQSLTVKDVRVVGPGTLMAWVESPALTPWFEGTYRRILGPEQRATTGGFRWW